MTTQNPSQPGDLFFKQIVEGYLSNPRFVRRDWLAEEIDHRLNTDGSRFVLLTAEPGFGKSAFMAQLAADHPDWPRYFIRRDQRESLSDAGARSFLMRIGFQVAERHPDLFAQDNIVLDVEQEFGTVREEGLALGVDIGKLVTSPFYRQVVVKVRQNAKQIGGSVVGVRIQTIISDPRLLPLSDLQHLALFDPASKLAQPLVILIDALDELRYQDTQDNILQWLTGCPTGDLPSNVRFVLTSRPPEGAVRLFMDKQQHVLQVFAITTRDRDETAQLSGQIDKDLEAYADKLASDAAIKTHLDDLPDGAAGFKQQAVAKADGNIGYLDALARAIDQALIKQDSQILAALLAVKTLPDALQDLYAFFLHQIMQSVARQRIEVVDPETGETYDKAVWPAVHSRMLAALAVAREPVTLDQIQYLGGITVGWADLNAAKDSLLQFLDVVDSRYRLYHATLPEFLTDTRTQENTETQDLYIDAGEWHKRIGERYWRSHSQDWSQCDVYGLAHLPAHLDAAEDQERLHTLYFDYVWLQAKLDRLGVNALLADFSLGKPAAGDAMRRLSQALEQGAYVLAQDPAQLAPQLLGRLLDDEDRHMQTLLAQAQTQCQRPCLLPRTASLREAGALLRTLSGHKNEVVGVAVTPDGRHAVSASEDSTLKVWDLASGQELRTLAAHTNGVTGVAVTPDGSRAVSASSDKTLKVWDLASGEVLHTLTGHRDTVCGVAVTPDGRCAVSASGDETLKAWDLASGQELRTLTGHTGWVTGVAVTPDGSRAVSASSDKTLRVWDLASGQDLRTLTGHTSWVTGVAVTPDGSRVVSASYDTTLKVWDLASGKVLRTLKGHKREVSGVAVTPNGSRAVSGSWDGTLRVWDLANGKVLNTLTGHTHPVLGVALTPHGSRAVSASEDNTLKVWNISALLNTALASGQELRTLTGHTAGVSGVAVTPDGRRAVSASYDKTLKVWDLASGKVLRTLPSRRGSISVLWRVLTLLCRSHSSEQSPAPSTSSVTCVAVTPDGSCAVFAPLLGNGGILKVWDLASGVELRTLTGHTRSVDGVALTLDGNRAVSASRDYTLKVWDLTSGVELYTLMGHMASVSGVAVTPDGRRAVSASYDTTLKVWDLASGRELHTLVGHTSAVMGVGVTWDDSRGVSASWDTTLKVWDLASGSCLATFCADGPLDACAVTTDGRTIVTAGASGQVHFLRLEE